MDDNEQTIDDNGIVKALCLHVAHDCNLRCGYCFASTGGFDGTRCLMPYEVGKRRWISSWRTAARGSI